MPGGGKEGNTHVSISDFLKNPKYEDAVNKFKGSLSLGDGRRVKFWWESVNAKDHPTLVSLLCDNCKDGEKQLKDVRPDDKEDYKFKDSPEVAQNYAEELRSRMESDLQVEFSKWEGKDDAIKNIEPVKKPRKLSCSIL